MKKDELIVKICKKVIVVFGILTAFNFIMLISGKSYALFTRTITTNDPVIHIETAKELPGPKANEELQIQIANHKTESCDPSIADVDGTIYLSGTNECINFNYVWYSGKLWRIFSINTDGTMKMITESSQGVLSFNDRETNYIGNDFQNSLAYQWLNEDFLDTLYNYENIIVPNASWNITPDNGADPTKPEKLPDQKLVTATVGLISAYEYYMSYQHGIISSKEDRFGDTYPSIETYLKNGDSYYTLTPFNYNNENYLWFNAGTSGYSDGGLTIEQADYEGTDSFRPVVMLKKDIKFTSGDGTVENPYQLLGDNTINLTNENHLNKRINGEYVNFDNNLYQIIGAINDENNNKITKLILATYDADFDYLNFVGNYGTGLDETSLDYYFNNNFYNSISQGYKKMLVKSVYYLGTFGIPSAASVSGNYKGVICKDPLTTKTTKTCEKVDDKWIGYVGLPMIGEVLNLDYVTVFINKMPENDEKIYRYSGGLYDDNSKTYGPRPTITLSQDVIITSGIGTKNDPFEITLS